MSTLNIDYPLSKDRIIQLLLAHNIQPTQQRVLVAEVLFARPQHLSADQIKDSINRPDPDGAAAAAGTKVSKATVYNTLGLFAQKGLVNEVIVDPSRVFYDSNTTPHYHRYNIDTGALEDIECDQLEIGRLPELPENIEVTGVDVIVRVRDRRN